MVQKIVQNPKDFNYSCVLVKVEKIIPIENADNLVHVSVYGNSVVVGKDVKIGDYMLFFPVETQLSKELVAFNNLYRDSTLNRDDTKRGFLEDNRRIKALRLRGAISQGLLLPIHSLNFLCDSTSIMGDKLHLARRDSFYILEEHKSFDNLFDTLICNKYVVKNEVIATVKSNKLQKKIDKTEILDKQFRFHYDTEQLGKNVHKLKPDTLISITRKLHGTSVVISSVLVKKRLSIFEKILKMLKVNIQDVEYKNVYSSRKVFKNLEIDKNTSSFYEVDIWGKTNNYIISKLRELPKGISIYAEIVGYTDEDKYIQQGYDYGCENGKYDVYVYRITYTNVDGFVHELSAKQVQLFCKKYDILAVPELYYGYVKDLTDGEDILTTLSELFLEKDCPLCTIKNTPDEGIVVRIEDGYDEGAYKLKSFRFYEKESISLDKKIIDIESDN